MYHVGMKILLWKGDEVLLLRDAKTEHLDLPGGRIDDNEDNIPILNALKREVREELGSNVEYKIGEFLFHYRRFSPEMTGKNRRVFINVYSGTYLGGEIELSHEHRSYEWANPITRGFSKEDFLSDTEEYNAFKFYFEKIAKKGVSKK